MKANTTCPQCHKDGFKMATSILCVSPHCDNYASDVEPVRIFGNPSKEVMQFYTSWREWSKPMTNCTPEQMQDSIRKFHEKLKEIVDKWEQHSYPTLETTGGSEVASDNAMVVSFRYGAAAAPAESFTRFPYDVTGDQGPRNVRRRMTRGMADLRALKRRYQSTADDKGPACLGLGHAIDLATLCPPS